MPNSLPYKEIAQTKDLWLDVSNKEFHAAYREVVEQKTGRLRFWNMLQPHLRHWHQMLTHPGSVDDRHFTALCIEMDRRFDNQGLDAIARYCYWAELQTSLHEELETVMWLSVKKMKYLSHFKDSRMAEDFAIYFRSRLAHAILKRRSRLDDRKSVVRLVEQETWNEIPDTILFRAIALDPWDNYLFTSFVNDTTGVKQVAKLSKISRRVVAEEWNLIWNWIKAEYSATEL